MIDKISRVLICILIVFLQNVSADEVYKWTDAQGRVHFGDQQGKPSTEKGIGTGIYNQKIKQPTIDYDEVRNQIIQDTIKKHQIEMQPNPVPNFDPNAAEFGTRKVDASCQEIAERIAKRRSHNQLLENQFRRECSGVTYYCEQYKQFPEKDKCYWVKQRRKTIVEMKIYQ